MTTELRVFTGNHPHEVINKAMAAAKQSGAYIESFQTTIHAGLYTLTVLLVKSEHGNHMDHP